MRGRAAPPYPGIYRVPPGPCFSFRENKGIVLYNLTKTGGDDSSSLIEFTPL